MYLKWIVIGIALLFALKSKATIYVFYAAPYEDIVSQFEACCSDYIKRFQCNENDLAFSYVLLDKITAPAFRKNGPPHLARIYNELVSSSSILRTNILDLNALSNGRVSTTEIFLVDDSRGLDLTNPCNEWYQLTHDNKAIWPSSECVWVEEANYKGRMAIGEKMAERIMKEGEGGVDLLFETVNHHFVHTQFRNEIFGEDYVDKMKTNYLGNYKCNLFFRNSSHNRGELLYELHRFKQEEDLSDFLLYRTWPWAIEEGLASFWSIALNEEEQTNLVHFINDSAFRFTLVDVYSNSDIDWYEHVEWYNGPWPVDNIIDNGKGDIMYLSGQSYNKYQENKGKQNFKIIKFKLKDLPFQMIFRSGYMNEMYFYLFYLFADEEKAKTRQVLYTLTGEMTAPSNRGKNIFLCINKLSSVMEDYLKESDSEGLAKGHLSGSGMFPYALFDILSNFQDSIAVKRFLESGFEPDHPVKRTVSFDKYWAHRDAIKALVGSNIGGNIGVNGDGPMDILKAVELAKGYCDGVKISLE